MRLKNISWQNIGSFGNAMQCVEFGNVGGLYMVLGKNGNGKCLSPDTIIDIQVNKDIETLLIEFLKNKKNI